MGLDSQASAQHAADKPKDGDVLINFKTSSGIRDFASYKLGSYKEGAKFFKRGIEIVQARKLLGAEGSLELRRLRAQCRGSSPGEVYSVEADMVAHENGRDLDWAEVKCSCPHAEKAPVCKHVLAVLLARLDPAAWQAAGGEVQADWAAAEAGRSPGTAAGSGTADIAATPARETAAAAAGSGVLEKTATPVKETAAPAAGSADLDRAATPVRGTAAAAAAGSAALDRAATAARGPAAAAAGSAVMAVREVAAPVPAPARPMAQQAPAAGRAGVARKRRLPNLTGPASPAAKRAAPSKAPKPQVNTVKARAGVQSAPAAGGAARGAPLIMFKRKEGKQLLEEDDDELVRQCHQALSGAATRSGDVQPDRQQQSVQQPAGNQATQQQSVQQPAGDVNTQQPVAAAADVKAEQPVDPSAAGGEQAVRAAVRPESSVPGSPGPAEPAAATAVVPPGGPSMFDELFGAGGAFS